MQRKMFTAEVKARTRDDGGQPGEFSAVVAVYDNVDRAGDRIKAGAFDETLAGWRKSGDPIPVVLAHGWDDPFKHIGYADPADVKSVPGRGLVVEKAFLDVDDNPIAKQVHRLMERRTLKEFSFGYTVNEGGERKAEDGAYDLTSLNLIEFGPCLKGVNEETELLAVKAELEASRKSEEPTMSERLTRLEALVAEMGGTSGTAEETDEQKAEREAEESKLAEKLADEEAAYEEKAQREDQEREAAEKKAQDEEDARISSADVSLMMAKAAVENQERLLSDVVDFDEKLDAAQRQLDDYEGGF